MTKNNSHLVYNLHRKRMADGYSLRGGLPVDRVLPMFIYPKVYDVIVVGAGHAGIEAAVESNQAAYIASWLRSLRNDRTMVIKAASKAQRASDFILDREV